MNIIGLLIIVGAGIWYYFRFQKARQIIHKWATENKYEVTELKYIWFVPKHVGNIRLGLEMVYRIDVQTSEQEQKKGYMILGSVFSGLSNDSVEVSWDTD